MSLTALQVHGEGLSAAGVGEYHGATTAARFSDINAELAALRAGCGAYDLGFRAKFSVTGRDRVRWLNGMVTNKIRDLAAGQGVYAFLLTPQGHILGDLYAYNRGESISLDTDQSQAEKIFATLKRYIIMDDVQIANVSEELTALGIAGPKAREVLGNCGFAVPEVHLLQIQSVSWRGIECSLVCGERGNWEIWVAASSVRQLWDALVGAGATPVGFEALEQERIEAGIPVYGADIRDRDLPQETDQIRALNFNKGCYIGQEIVERIRSRGAVHRKFSGFLVDGDAAVGSKIWSDGKEVGEITSVAALPVSDGKRLALGYIRRDAGATGREVNIGSTRATVVQLPLTPQCLQENSLEQRPA